MESAHSEAVSWYWREAKEEQLIKPDQPLACLFKIRRLADQVPGQPAQNLNFSG